MTKENEIKLIRAIAITQVGNSKFEKKYGIDCINATDLLKTYEKDIDPPEEILEKANELYIDEFSNQVINLLEKNQPEEFFKDLIFNSINSVI